MLEPRGSRCLLEEGINGVVDALDACDEEEGYSSLSRLCIAMACPGLKGFAKGFRGFHGGRGDPAGSEVGSALVLCAQSVVITDQALSSPFE
jgi:hypothetical protein